MLYKKKRNQTRERKYIKQPAEMPHMTYSAGVVIVSCPPHPDGRGQGTVAKASDW